MVTTVEVIVPWRDSGCPHRAAALDRVVAHLREELTNARVTLADIDDDRPFNRGRALNRGAAASTADVLCFADADVLVPGANLRAAVDFAAAPGVGYVVPFDSITMLTLVGSNRARASMSPFDELLSDEDVDMRWERLSTGGCNVITRAAFELAGGFDDRFAGWGYEDAALDGAVTTLVGRGMWLHGDARHLWHPHDPTRSDDALTAAGLVLARRYEDAHGDVLAMSALIDEAKAAKR